MIPWFVEEADIWARLSLFIQKVTIQIKESINFISYSTL